MDSMFYLRAFVCAFCQVVASRMIKKMHRDVGFSKVVVRPWRDVWTQRLHRVVLSDYCLVLQQETKRGWEAIEVNTPALFRLRELSDSQVQSQEASHEEMAQLLEMAKSH